ncbi:glycosyltransferase family 2 protein [Halopiger djelfimassiliensis]|uniref:glycosyltransferase family 2 protein n=1 Tax=Halopiger djelfimassiliensis TaxID=1293047 RepID=UPI0018A84543|nr:glycosyltransferase family 2 protein [Halopiger djelfimassiliensis]
MPSLNSPVAIFVFNRPETTKKVFEMIRDVEPDTLYVVADGPRADIESDQEKCRRTRAITENVDWNCTVHREYAVENLGLKRRFVTGLETIFSNEDRAIILEDDCVPNHDFFIFCDEMLERYEDDMRVWDISGTNYLGEWKPEQQDYHFSYYGGIWGWATWRRAWMKYDPKMRLWTEEGVQHRLKDVLASKSQYEYLRTVYDRTYQGVIETWDYQWGFARHVNSGLSVVPSRNLVTNVGFGDHATNTTNEGSNMANIPRGKIDFPLDFHDYVAVDRTFDEEFHKLRTSWWERNPVLRRLSDTVLR